MIGPRGFVRRWIAFGAVGALGFGVQFATLVLLTGWLEANYLIATAIAVELAILHNFFWHQRCTWSDRSVGGADRIAARLLRYNAGTALTSIGGNLVLMWVFVSWFGVHHAIANVMAVSALSILNFLFCDRLVFSRVLKNSLGTVTGAVGADARRRSFFVRKGSAGRGRLNHPGEHDDAHRGGEHRRGDERVLEGDERRPTEENQGIKQLGPSYPRNRTPSLPGQLLGVVARRERQVNAQAARRDHRNDGDIKQHRADGRGTACRAACQARLLDPPEPVEGRAVHAGEG